MKGKDTTKTIKGLPPEGRENPFLVPEGYFETFTQRLMSRLPDEATPQSALPLLGQQGRERNPRGWARQWWKYAAAVVVVCGVGLGALRLTLRQEGEGTSLATAGDDTETLYGEEYINDALDYAIVRNSDIELYLTEAQ